MTLRQMRPTARVTLNPSIERTSDRLRPLAATHVKRQPHKAPDAHSRRRR